MAYDLIRPAVSLYRETTPKIDMMAPVTTMNRIAQVQHTKLMILILYRVYGLIMALLARGFSSLKLNIAIIILHINI